MNTEKSIKLMNVIKSILPEHYNFDFGKPEIDEVIKRLQMWEGFKEKYKGCYLMVSQSARGLSHLMEEFEKEYFPKPVKKTVTIEFEATADHIITHHIDIIKANLKKGCPPVKYIVKED